MSAEVQVLFARAGEGEAGGGGVGLVLDEGDGLQE